MRDSRSPGDQGIRLASGLACGVAAGLILASMVAFYREVLNPFPLPFGRSRRAVRLGFRDRTGRFLPLNQESFDLIESHSTGFESLGAAIPVTTSEASKRYRATVEFATAGFFRVLDTKPAMGRLPAATTPGGAAEVLVTERFFRTRLNGDRARLGQVLAFDACQLVVVGVATKDMELWRRDAELWGRIEDLRLCVRDDVQRPEFFGTAALGILAHGVEPADVQMTLGTMLHNSLQEAGNQELQITVQRLASTVRTPAVQAALALFLLGAVATCATALVSGMSLQLAVIDRRRGDWVVRRTLGAAWSDIARTLCVDGLAGLAAGLLAAAVIGWIAGLQFETLGVQTRDADWTALALAAVAAMLGSCAAVGMLRIGAYPLAEGLRDIGTARAAKGYHVLAVAAQVAIATIATTLAAVCWMSTRRLETTPTGADLQEMVAVKLSWAGLVDQGGSGVAATLAGIESRLAEELRRPVGAGTDVPLAGTHSKTSIWLEDGRRVLRGQSRNVPGVHAVTSGYLTALGARLLEGRQFLREDNGSTQPVAIVSEAAARALWPGRSAVGQLFRTRPSGQWTRVVGVVADIRYESVEVPASPEIFLTYDALPLHSATLVLGRPEGSAGTKHNDGALAHRLTELGVAAEESQTGRAILGRQFAVARLLATATSLAALGMLAISGVATFALSTYVVLQRRAEVSLRLALGGTPGRVTGQVLRRSIVASAVGLGIGVAGVVPIGLWLRSALFGIEPIDMLSTAITGLVICAGPLAGSTIVARRQLRATDLAAQLRAT